MKRKYFVFCATSSDAAFKKLPVRTLYIRSKTDLLFLNLIYYVAVLHTAVFCQVEVGSTIALELDRRLQNDIQFNFDNCLQKRVLPIAEKLLTMGCAEGRKWGLM